MSDRPCADLGLSRLPQDRGKDGNCAQATPGTSLKRRWPYQASVMNRFEPTSSRMGSRPGEASVAAHAALL